LSVFVVVFAKQIYFHKRPFSFSSSWTDKTLRHSCHAWCWQGWFATKWCIFVPGLPWKNHRKP